eukprot:GFUD01038110.1.p1 GENE.GFUD01038110.1~~GFUD01038110.1.p1  ORF type:complete len:154 (+),score=6.61 GFUD01038110.1:349-810(+)
MQSLVKAARQCAQPSAHARQLHFSVRAFSSVTVTSAGSSNGGVTQSTRPSSFSQPSYGSPAFLQAPSVLLNQTAGIKHVGELSLRCRHCYYAIKDEQKFVMCTAKPRHYQAQKMPGKKWGNVILTHATQGSNRKGSGQGSRHMWTQQSFRLDY